jgi:hypothetical protein
MIRDGYRAARLLTLEHEDARLSARLHRDQRRRALLQEEARMLRQSFDASDVVQYERLKATAYR